MLKKVLIVEDHEIANISVQRTLAELNVQNIKYVYYCDDALTWITCALKDNDPYDLMITDLSFEEDHNKQRIGSGVELIQAIRAIQPAIKIIVFSGESRPAVIDDLFKKYAVDAYVRKARRDAQHLKEAFDAINKDLIYVSPDLKQLLKESNVFEFSSVDIHIVKFLAEGVSQKKIPEALKLIAIKPCSLSSIEKRLNSMREELGFHKNEQLVAYCKDKGFI